MISLTKPTAVRSPRGMSAGVQSGQRSILEELLDLERKKIQSQSHSKHLAFVPSPATPGDVPYRYPRSLKTHEASHVSNSAGNRRARSSSCFPSSITRGNLLETLPIGLPLTLESSSSSAREKKRAHTSNTTAVSKSLPQSPSSPSSTISVKHVGVDRTLANEWIESHFSTLTLASSKVTQNDQEERPSSPGAVLSRPWKCSSEISSWQHQSLSEDRRQGGRQSSPLSPRPWTSPAESGSTPAGVMNDETRYAALNDSESLVLDTRRIHTADVSSPSQSRRTVRPRPVQHSQFKPCPIGQGVASTSYAVNSLVTKCELHTFPEPINFKDVRAGVGDAFLPPIRPSSAQGAASPSSYSLKLPRSPKIHQKAKHQLAYEPYTLGSEKNFEPCNDSIASSQSISTQPWLHDDTEQIDWTGKVCFF